MANGSSVSSRGVENRAHNWDDPNGLGWRLWRRAQSTGLLTQSIQRDLARFRTDVLRDPVPLASEIRNRWAAGGNVVSPWFGGDLPFFLGRFPLFHRSRRQDLADTAVARRLAHTPQISLPYRTPPSADATISESPPASEAGAQDAGPAIPPQGSVGSADTPVNSVATRPAPPPVSFTQAESGGIGWRFASPSAAVSRSPQRRAPMMTVGTVPLNRGTTTVFSAIGERHNPMQVSLQRAGFKRAQIESRSPSTLLLQFAHESLAPSIVAPRGGESRTNPQDSLGPAAKPREYEPGQASSKHMPPPSRVAGSGEKSISISTKLSAAAATTGKPALITNRDSSKETGAEESATQRYAAGTESALLSGGNMRGIILRSPASRSPVGVGQAPFTVTRSRGYELANVAPNEMLARSIFAFAKGMTISGIPAHEPGIAGPTAPQPGGTMTGVILRALGTHSGVGVRLPLPAVAAQQSRRIFTSYLSKYSPSALSARAISPSLNSSAYRPTAGLDALARSEEVGIRMSVSSSGSGGSVGRNAASSEQPRIDVLDAPVIGLQRAAVEDAIASSTAMPLTSAVVSPITATAVQPYAVAPDDRHEPPAPSHEPRLVDSAGVYNLPPFTARKRVITSGLAAMPLSIAPVLKRERSMTESGDQRIYSERANRLAPIILRAEYQGSSTVDDVILGGESGAGIGISSGQGSRSLRTREVSDTNLIFGPLPSRAGTEVRRSSDDSTRTSGITSLAQSRGGKLPGTNVDNPLRVEASILRTVAGAEFATIHHSDPEGSLQGWVPLHQGRSSSGSFALARSLMPRTEGRPAAPLLIARSVGMLTAIEDQPPGVTTPTRANQSTVISPGELIRVSTVGATSAFHSQSAGLMAVLAPTRPLTLTPPALLRRSDSSAIAERRATASATRETSYEMPLVAPSIAAGERALTMFHHANGRSLQTAPQETASAASRALPIDAGAEVRAIKTPAAAAKPQIDLDELVEKAWHKLMRKLTIEQERRGYLR